jgi:tight adherence protein B
MQLIVCIAFLAIFALVALSMAITRHLRTARQTEATLASSLRSSLIDRGEEIVDVRKEHLFSSIPWVHNLLSHMNVAVELRRMLNQADLNWTPGRLMFACIGGWAVTGYIFTLRTHSPALGALVGFLAGSAPLMYVARKRRQRMAQFLQKLPEALDLMVSALRAGQSMGGALGAAAREAGDPVGRELRLCAEEQNFGIDLRTALDNLIERVPLQDLRMVATALLIHKESGGNLAEVLDKTSRVIRDRFQVLQQITVHTAQGRLTGWVLSLLPVGLAVIIYFVSPGYIELLFDRPLGQKIVAIAVAMNLVGLLIIRRIVKIRA